MVIWHQFQIALKFFVLYSRSGRRIRCLPMKGLRLWPLPAMLQKLLNETKTETLVESRNAQARMILP